MYYVYALIDPRYNIPFYVGKGKKINNRHADHVKETKKKNTNRHKFFKINHLKNLNLEIPVKILQDNIISEKDAYDIEKKYIKKHGRKNIDENGILTNICIDNRPPSQKGKKQSSKHIEKRMISTKKHIEKYGRKEVSLERRKKMSIAFSGEKNPFYGKTHSAETRLRISEKAKGSVKINKTYLFIDPYNRLHLVTNGFEKFCKENNLSLGTTEKILKTGRKTLSGKCAGWMVYKVNDDSKYPYSGLLELFETEEIVVKEGNKLKYVSLDGTEYKEFRKKFGPEILDLIMHEYDEVIKQRKQNYKEIEQGETEDE